MEPRTVSALTAELKACLEDAFPTVAVRGEISNFRRQASGHCYFTLKDAGAQLATVLFRGNAQRCTVDLRDGVQVVASGEISVYEARGNYQLIARSLVEDGVGRLQRAFEELKRRLAAEGLFEAARRKPLPALPARVGFITSPTGAAAQDVCRILIRRGWRGRLFILPARVQGADAPADIAGQIAWAQTLVRADDGAPREAAPGDPRPPFLDLLLIGRGGGSIEDLWCFNDETVVRAVAACTIPTISCVGHETDFTLCDFAADLRAETPSAAAELVSSGFLEMAQRHDDAAERLERLAATALERLGGAVELLARRLAACSPEARLRETRLRLERAGVRLDAAGSARLQRARLRTERAAAALARHDPAARAALARQRLDSLAHRLDASSLPAALRRGFAVVRDASGAPVTRAAAVAAGAAYTAEFADGRAALRGEVPPRT